NKFGYRLDDYQEFPEKNLITLRTSWNLRGAERAVFSGSGIRRMAFVEIEEIEVPGGHIPMPPGANEKTSRPMFKEITLDNGQRRFVTTKLALSVRQERNVSILEADDPSKGDWEDYGSDSEEIEQILVMIRSRIDEMAGREFGMSERAKKAHEDYLKEGQLTPEEIDERYDRLKDKK
ncbi:MAG: hypothetical protein L6Q71_10615, partial [Planctomycetes bacterium]|nr:hypothetical protein [Planctomycetota bacterium]